MKETGNLLKSAREEKNISLKEVALATKIHINTLRAIEGGDMDHLPHVVFLRGFIQAYALFLKIDPQPILDVFKEEMVEHQEVESLSPVKSEDEGSHRAVSAANKSSNTVRNIMIGIGAFILIVFIGYLQKIVKKYEQEASVPFKGEVIVGEDRALSQTTDLSSTTMMKALTTTSRATKQTSSTTFTRVGSQELIVEALGAVTLKYKIDGESFKKIQLQPEQTHIFKAEQSLEFEFSDGGRVSVIHNGRDIGVPGMLGESLKIKYP